MFSLSKIWNFFFEKRDIDDFFFGPFIKYKGVPVAFYDRQNKICFLDDVPQALRDLTLKADQERLCIASTQKEKEAAERKKVFRSFQ